MTEEAFEQLQQQYQTNILHFLQQQKEILADGNDQYATYYAVISDKIQKVEEAVSSIFETEEKIEKIAPPMELKPLSLAPTPEPKNIPSVIYTEKPRVTTPILVEKLDISVFLTLQKDEQTLSIPISYFSKKPTKDVAAFLDIYWHDMKVGFGVDYNGIPWNMGEHDNSYEFESHLISSWFEGIKNILQGKEKVSIAYWEQSTAYLLRRDAKYILLEDPGFAPLIQISLDDFLPSFLTACIEYLSFLDVVEPIIKQILKQKENPNTHLRIMNDLDILHFRKRVRHFRRNLYSSSSF